MEIIPSLSAEQRSHPPIDYMVSFSLIVHRYLIKPLIHISQLTLLSSPCLQSPIGTSLSHIGISHSSLIGISHSSPIGISHSSPIGICHSFPIKICRSSPIRICHSSPIGICRISPFAGTPFFHLFILIQLQCSRCSLQSSRISDRLHRSILISGASYFNIILILNSLNSSQELRLMELEQGMRGHSYV